MSSSKDLMNSSSNPTSMRTVPFTSWVHLERRGFTRTLIPSAKSKPLLAPSALVWSKMLLVGPLPTAELATSHSVTSEWTLASRDSSFPLATPLEIGTIPPLIPCLTGTSRVPMTRLTGRPSIGDCTSLVIQSPTKLVRLRDRCFARRELLPPGASIPTFTAKSDLTVLDTSESFK